MLLLAAAHAATLTVGSGGYATIGAAESAAASGDTIAIEAGSWAEDLAPSGKDLTYSGDGATIAGSTGDPCYDAYSGEDVTLEGLTFDGCTRAVQVGGSGSLTVDGVTFSGNGSASVGAAIYATNTATVTVTDSVFSDNTAADGGAIYADGDVVLDIDGSDFSAGSASSTGGEIRTGGAVTFTLTESTFDTASAGDGGCLYLTGTGAVSLDTVLLSGCTASSQGGAIYLSSASSASFSELSIEASSANNGGAIATWTDLSLEDFDLSENTATTYGGHLYAPSTALTLSEGTLSGGEAYQGGAIYLYSDALVASEVVFEDNLADDRGGAIYATTVPITFELEERRAGDRAISVVAPRRREQRDLAERPGKPGVERSHDGTDLQGVRDLCILEVVADPPLRNRDPPRGGG